MQIDTSRGTVWRPRIVESYEKKDFETQVKQVIHEAAEAGLKVNIAFSVDGNRYVAMVIFQDNG